MGRSRISTTVDSELLTTARRVLPVTIDSALIDAALAALVAQCRSAEVDAAYAAYDDSPMTEPDEWGVLAEWSAAAGAS